MSGKCRVCTKSVYPMDPQINLDGVILHKPCAKCEDCNCQITTSNFTKCDDVTSGKYTLLCKVHYFKRFHEGGSYIGGDKFKGKTASNGAVSDPTVSTPKPVVTPAPVKEEPPVTVFENLKVVEEKTPIVVEEPVVVVEEPVVVVEEPVVVVEEPVETPVVVEQPVVEEESV